MSTEMEAMIRKILEDMQQGGATVTASAPAQAGSTDTQATVADYPIAQKHPDWIKVRGSGLDFVTLDNVMSGAVTMEDLRISPAILKAQGQIAKDGGREQIEYNFSRAAEMTKVSDKRLLKCIMPFGRIVPPSRNC